MRKILFFVIFLIFISKITAFGVNQFYAEFILTNGEYGFGAQFPSRVWFNGNTGQMRVDYFNPSGVRFMSQYYNYITKDRYSVCSDGKCTRATWTATQPIFVGNSSTYQSVTCERPDWPGPRSCTNFPNCASFRANPPQPSAILSLSYFDATNYRLCLVRWAVARGNTFGSEWHILNYVTTGFNTTSDPRPDSVYQSVIDSATSPCPTPICRAELDIALIIDESGSIFSASAWNDVQNFVRGTINALDIKDGGIRVGLAYFSGLSRCDRNWSVTSGSIVCPGNINDCTRCGARWQQMTTGVITSKANLIAKVDGNSGAGGLTCISCGLDIGIKLLNFAPKANVQKLIILLTDGEQNRVTSTLKLQGDLAKAMGIKIIGVGVGDYKIGDLQQFATTIYESPTFSGLVNIIKDIVTPLCEPIVDDCNFCSGLCSCSTTCNCPACNDFNACTTDRCDPRLPPDGTAGLCVPVTRICDDSDVCTQNLCNNSTGCDFTQPAPRLPNQVDTFCKRWVCTNPSGYQITDVGETVCVQPSDRCIIRYCNTTVGSTVVAGATLTGSCVTINRTDPAFPAGTVINYVNSLGQNLTTSGCARPSFALPCDNYNCVAGQCTYSTTCVCRVNADCDDGDGCTTDVCDTTLNRCIRTPVDCWSNLSGANCRIGVNTTQMVGTGQSFYESTATFPLDANGLPPGNVTRSCDLLACYGGQRSTYTCFSVNNATFSCRRQVTPCTSSACLDSSCRSLGTWSSRQMNTDCGRTVARTCTDGSLCTSDQCNSTWTGTSCFSNGTCTSSTGGNRCLFPSNATNCNDQSVCTTDSCIPATGCQYTARPLPPTNACFNVGCNPTTGNFTTVNNAVCTPPTDRCQIRYCNTTSQGCVTWDKNVMALGTSVTFVDQFGQTQTVVGCSRTPTANDCRAYSCDTATGLCIITEGNCTCNVANDPRCDDNNGCTVDFCNTTTGRCSNTPIDCFNVLSNGGCRVNQGGLSQTAATGLNNYNNQNGADLPFVPATLPSQYNCDNLACYSGIRSTYTCNSVNSTSYTCDRVKAPCPKGGCRDTICTTLGTWSNGQLNTDCSTEIVPTCTSNACFVSQCDTSFVFGSGNPRCIVTSNATNCEDNNACTQNLCNNSTGCFFTSPTPNPFGANRTCVGYTCNTLTGWEPVDLGISQCTVISTNPCQVTYCNTTLNQCFRLDRGDIPLGQTVTYVDSAGITQSITGCRKTDDPLRCKTYTCDTNTGQCTTSTAGCNCVNDASCFDGDGCTIDVCDFNLNQCNRTVVDCYSMLSNGTCRTNSPFNADLFTGINLYYGNATVPNNFTSVDANGLPSPSVGVVRTCGQLGCYNGQPSQYSCFSAQEGTYVCQRTFVNCSRNGCQDNICRTNGTWSNGQINSDCGTIFRPFCADNDACTNDFCNSAWKPTDPVASRCLHTPIDAAKFCDDGNFCTRDFCDTKDTSGDVCKHALYNTAYIKKFLCTNATSVCQTVQCTVNRCVYGEVQCLPPTLCLLNKCNETTKGVCKQFPTGIYFIDKCGICGGNGLSCVPTNPGNPKRTSIAVALGVGLGVGLAAAAIIIFILSKKSYDFYSALATETQGTVTTAPTYQGGEHHFDPSGYNK